MTNESRLLTLACKRLVRWLISALQPVLHSTSVLQLKVKYALCVESRAVNLVKCALSHLIVKLTSSGKFSSIRNLLHLPQVVSKNCRNLTASALYHIGTGPVGNPFSVDII